MSLLSRIKTWITGDLLYAADLNSEFNNIINDHNGGLNMTNIDASISPTWTGTHTFTGGNLKIKGAGVGIASLTNANTASNRIITIPDPGADSTLVALAGTQTLTGNKTFSGNTVFSGGADSLLLPTTAPVSGVGAFAFDNIYLLQVCDGSTIFSMPAVDNLSTLGASYNLRLSLSSGTLKVLGANGLDCSNTNPGFVCVPVIGGGPIVLKLTTAVKWDGKGAADSDFLPTGAPFGTTAGVAWGLSRPFYLYAINTSGTDSGLYLGFSPCPTLVRTPAAGSGIGYADVVPTVPADTNMMFMTTTNTTALTSKPCVCIGSIQATKDTSDDWTWASLGANSLGRFCDALVLTMPVSQMGAASGKYLLNTTGTAPTFTTNSYFYKLSREGVCSVSVFLSGDGGTPGATSGSISVAAPYTSDTSTNARWGRGTAFITTPTYSQFPAGAAIGSGVSFFTINRNTSSTATTAALNTDFTAGAREISFGMSYQAFPNIVL